MKMLPHVIWLFTFFVSTFALDTSPSSKPYGLCKVTQARSHWCKLGAIKSHPLLKSRMKYGRQTVFSGPVGIQKGWCGKILRGSNSTAVVALSQKYIKKASISPKSEYCGKCVCIMILDVDETSNKFPPQGYRKFTGKVLKGVVKDQCPECEDDHIDLLADRPYTTAPTSGYNPKARYFNSIPGPRLMSEKFAYGVGVWKVQWNFVDCKVSCRQFFKL